MGLRDQPNPPNGRPFLRSPGSLHYGTPRVCTIRQGDDLARPTPERQKLSLRYRRYLGGTGMLTGFPFDCLWLRTALGPTNPRLTIIVEEPEPLRRWGFSPHFAVTTARILIPTRSTRTHARASIRAGRLPTGSGY